MFDASRLLLGDSVLLGDVCVCVILCVCLCQTLTHALRGGHTHASSLDETGNTVLLGGAGSVFHRKAQTLAEMNMPLSFGMGASLPGSEPLGVCLCVCMPVCVYACVCRCMCVPV